MSKHKMSLTKPLKKLGLILTLSALSINAPAATTQLSNTPLVTSTGSSIQPNIFYVLDDSGSMNWNYLPDWANDNHPVSGTGYASMPELFTNNDFNGVAYNPAITYKKPVFYATTGTLDTTTYPDMIAPWTAVKDDGYGVQSTSTSNLVGSAYSYVFVPGEYCTSVRMTTCVPATSPVTVSGVSYTIPAKLRWCDSATLSNCQSINDTSTFKYPRYPGLSIGSTATITITGGGAASSIKVNGFEILSAATTSSTTTSTVASRIVTNINSCTSATSGSCTIAGYSASRTNSTITISAPSSLGAITFTPSVTGTMSSTVTAFNGAGMTVPGSNIRTDIVSGTNSYAYPGTTSKASTRSDCAGSTCSYIEEMNNYANWWAYYHTRMQMMKTSASLAFSPLCTDPDPTKCNYRVGYMSINDNNNDFVNIKLFDKTQKYDWYNKFFHANPGNSTPLRTALTKAGRLYAGKLNNSTLNGSTVVDPLQYSCQQNFTILSTDGYWNESNPGGYQIDGSTAIGNQDNADARPMYDGTINGTSTTTTVVTSTTPTSTINRSTKVTGQSVSTPWNRNLISTSATANCTIPVTTPTCQQDNGANSANKTRTWCMENNASKGSDCASFGSTVYACRGSSKSTNLPGGSPDAGCVTDGSGQSWCIYPNNTTAGTTACGAVYSGNSLYVCKQAVAGPGYTVTSQPQLYTEAATQTKTDVTDTTTTTNHVVVTTNGVVTSDTTSAPTTTTTTTTSTATLTDSGAPSGTTTWANNGTAITSCSSSPSPAPGASTTSTPTSGTSTATTTSGPTTTTSTIGPTVGTTTSTTSTSTTTTAASGGTSNTLADVAEYYYNTDLRDSTLSNCTGSLGTDVCQDNVPVSGIDRASWQHMTTFTLGLGASGLMQYTSDYATTKSDDYGAVYYGTAAGTIQNGSIMCEWQASGSGECNWPVPVANTQTTIDDLWHAGVNGRGAYFSARNPSSLTTSLTNALAGVSARLGASAAATTSNPNVTTGDNFVFSSTFISQEWTGQLVRQTLDLNTGVVSPYADWTARSQLDALTYTSRVIYTFDSTGGTGGNKLKLFTYANLNATEQGYFDKPNIATMSQLCAAGASCLSTADQLLAQGNNLVNYLAGDRTNEGTTDVTKYYRTRAHVLGDIVDAEAAYVKAPQQKFVDTGYADFATAQANRTGMVYVAANDGLLHAFKAGGSVVATGDGVEQWAYIPSAMLPNLYKLADKNYATQHQFFVDGTPVTEDICPTTSCAGSQWKTILVGGYNAGGIGYYALDVTNPASPRAIWEFSDATMGYSYGNPRIGKLADGTWVVVLTSGYNNVPPYAASGDGVGYLYVLNAYTGTLIRKISTGVGNALTPSGLAKITAQVVNPSFDSTIVAVYGGDLLGNVWRFDINNNVGAGGYDAQLLATLKGPTPASNAQPITTKPEIGKVSGQTVVYVGTGSYLGLSDVTDTSVQTMYAIKDTLGTSSYGNPRSNTCASNGLANCFVKQTYTATTCPAGSPASVCTTGQQVVTATDNPVDFANQNGWYADLPRLGERSNTDPILVLGTLLFTTNMPDTTACTAGGYSFLYFLDYRNGGTLASTANGVVATSLGNSLATRPVVVRLPSGAVVTEIMMAAPTTGDSSTTSSSGSSSCIGGDCLTAPPISATPPMQKGAANPRRASWHEILIDK